MGLGVGPSATGISTARRPPADEARTTSGSLKANVLWAAAELGGGTAIGLRAGVRRQRGGALRRGEADGRVQLHILKPWAYPDLGWGNISTGLEAGGDQSGEVRVRLIGGNAAPHPPGR